MIELIITCVQAKAKDIEAYKSTERLVKLQEVKNLIDLSDYYAMAKSLGYALQKKGGLMLHQDWHASYGLGRFKGEEVICVYHSAIHHFYRFTSKRKIERLKPLYELIDGERHKYCKGCDDYFPATKEFFYGISRASETQLESLCKACYIERYKRPKYITGKTYKLRSVA